MLTPGIKYLEASLVERICLMAIGFSMLSIMKLSPAEFGIGGQIIQRDAGESGEQFDGVRVGLDQSGNVGTKVSVSTSRG